MKKIHTVPAPFRTVIKWMTDESDWRHLGGDYEEIYDGIFRTKGKIYAGLWVVKQLFNAAAMGINDSILWGVIMFRNHLKIALRNACRQKAYSLINILGLAVGLTCTILIMLWVQDEWSFDRYNRQAKRIFRVVTVDDAGGSDPYFAVTPIAMAPAVKSEIPEIRYAARMTAQRMGLHRDEKLIGERGLLVSPDFLKMFTLELLSGDPDKALESSERILISDKLAERHFGLKEPLGLTLRTQAGSEFVVSGVFKSPPRQSHLNYDYLMNFNVVEKNGRDLNNWGDISFYTYVLLEKKADFRVVGQKITAAAQGHLPEIKPSFELQPLTGLYLDRPYKFDNISHGSRQSVIFFSIIAVVILLIASINFVNLSTARAGRRMKEVGLRKVVGARRMLLIRQFFSESIMITLTAACAALLGVILLLPLFNAITGKDFSPQILTSQLFLPFIGGIIIMTGIASGFYPALFLSSFHPAVIFRAAHCPGSKGSPIRKILIVFQFALTIAVIAGSLVTESQLRFLKHKELGYNSSHLMSVYMGRTLARQYETVKQRLLQNPLILHAAATANLPTDLQSGSIVNDWEGKNFQGNLHFKLLWVDPDYIDTFGIKLADGRFYGRRRDTGGDEFVINQAAADAMELDSPVGKRAVINHNEGTIIGVVKDFHFRSLHHTIEPVALLFEPTEFYSMVIRLSGDNMDYQSTIGYIRDLWKELAPDLAFNYTFLEDQLIQLYQGEQVLGRLFKYFTGLSIFIACLGLLGMASFTAEQRTKEIGIRKVLGASTWSITGLLVKEFVKWIAFANIFALPFAYFSMSKWLQNYAYHCSLSAGIFLAASLAALILAVVTVSVQSIRAAWADPVSSLRQE